MFVSIWWWARPLERSRVDALGYSQGPGLQDARAVFHCWIVQTNYAINGLENATGFQDMRSLWVHLWIIYSRQASTHNQL